MIIFILLKNLLLHILKKTYDRSLRKYKIVIKKLTIPKYFLTDGCTYCIDHLSEEKWLIHDWLFSNHKSDDGTLISFEDANSILTPYYRKILAQSFGKKSWNSSGKRGPQFINIK